MRPVLEFYRSLAAGYGRLGFPAKVLFFVAITLVTLGIAVVVIVSLPADHFTGAPAPQSWWRRHPVLRVTVLGLKNLLGLVVLPLGILMALPLVPGPGLVFIVIGLSLLDFPGKRRLERRLLATPSVRGFLNDVRARCGRKPLDFEQT